MPLPKLPPPLRIGSPQHLHWPNPFPASTWSSHCSALFCLEGFGESSGFYHGKLKSATTAFCPLHVVMLKCRRHSVGINSLVPQMVKNLPAVQETKVRSLGWEDPLEKEMATHSSILTWKISWTEEPGGLQSMGSQRVVHDWLTNTFSEAILNLGAF